jgi:Beta-ketoacyl synthase, N-terminal domain
MTTSLHASVAGLGFWSPTLPSWPIARDVLLGIVAPAVPAARAGARLLAPTERRRASDTIAIALEVAASACEMAKMDPCGLPSIFASTHGDLAINDYMCSTVAATPTLCSPTKFHNSVHNAASGYWTIGTGCMKQSTALTAWMNTFANGLLEALVQATADDTPVLFVAYDVATRGPLAAILPSSGMLAAALILDPRTDARGLKPRLSCCIEDEPLACGSAPVPPRWADILPDNAMRQCLPLFSALASSEDSSVLLGLSVGCRLAVAVKAGVAHGPQ